MGKGLKRVKRETLDREEIENEESDELAPAQDLGDEKDLDKPEDIAKRK